MKRTADDGATSVEYALMASLIAVVIASTVATLGTTVAALFQDLLTAMGW